MILSENNLTTYLCINYYRISYTILYVHVIIFSIAILPKNWRRYTVPQSLTVIQWIADFSDRIQQLRQISQVSHSGSSKGLKVIFKHCSASRYRFVVGLKHPMEYGGAGPG